MDVIFKSWYTIWLEWFMNGIPHPFLFLLIVLSSSILLLLAIISIFSAIFIVSRIYTKLIRCLVQVIHYICRQINQIRFPVFNNRNRESDRRNQSEIHKTAIRSKIVAPKRNLVDTRHKHPSPTAAEIIEQLQISFCKKQPSAKFPSPPRQLTRNLIYINRDPKSSNTPYLQRPFILYRDKLYLRTRIPPNIDLYALYQDESNISTPQWSHTPPKTSGYPTPKYNSTPPPSSHHSDAGDSNPKSSHLTPISDRSNNSTSSHSDPSQL